MPFLAFRYLMRRCSQSELLQKAVYLSTRRKKLFGSYQLFLLQRISQLLLLTGKLLIKGGGLTEGAGGRLGRLGRLGRAGRERNKPRRKLGGHHIRKDVVEKDDGGSRLTDVSGQLLKKSKSIRTFDSVKQKQPFSSQPHTYAVHVEGHLLGDQVDVGEHLGHHRLITTALFTAFFRSMRRRWRRRRAGTADGSRSQRRAATRAGAASR